METDLIQSQMFCVVRSQIFASEHQAKSSVVDNQLEFLSDNEKIGYGQGVL